MSDRTPIQAIIAVQAGVEFPDYEVDVTEAAQADGFEVGAEWAFGLVEKQLQEIADKPRDLWTTAETYGVVSQLVGLIYEDRETR